MYDLQMQTFIGLKGSELQLLLDLTSMAYCTSELNDTAERKGGYTASRYELP